ncbi:hypothetical protein DF052_00115 [Burkholderia glumae]|uniref:STY1053 family phage-associated protein n=1 Tax=Burkholderia glumae TaxID=337 RepID=UPI000F5E1889|nr:hypothetical protein [Burkholderia glumae]RQZ76398.1 hypothetical protein DF052_00115 [Burkholderia glumae]
MENVKLHVHTPFTLRHDDGTLEQFSEGERDFPVAVAEHWYVKHHTRAPGDAPKPAVEPVDGADLAAARAVLDAQAAQLSAARDEVSAEAGRLAAQRVELEAMERDLAARADGLDMREAAVDVREQTLATREKEHDARVAALDAAQKPPADNGTQRGGKRA